MPKQTFHINRFEGGLNTDSAPEDIADNELLIARGASVSKLGRIVMAGNPSASSGITAVDVTQYKGYGLFAFNSDYAADGSVSATKYLVQSDSSNSFQVWDGSNWSTSWGVDMGSNGSVRPSFYAPNGDMRVCDGDFSHTGNSSQWAGYIQSETIGIASNDTDCAIGGAWKAYESSIEGGFPKDSSGYATNSVFFDLSSIDTDNGGTNNGYGLFDSALNPHGTCEWGANIEYVPASDSNTSSSLSGSTWQPTVSTEYKFYVSFIYDGIQEGNPTPMTMYPSLTGLQDGADAISKQSGIRFIDRSNSGNYNFCKVSRSGTTVTVDTYDDYNRTSAKTHTIEVGDTILIEGSDDLGGYYTVTEDTNTDTFKYEHGTSGAVAAENAYYSKVGTNLAVYFAPVLKFNNADTTTYNFGSSTIGGTSGGNERITGVRYYYSDSTEGHANLWILMEADFRKGVKSYGIGKEAPVVTDFAPFIPTGGTAPVSIRRLTFEAAAGDNVFKHPPKYETYESLNGYSHNSKLNAKWKTAVIANGRAYIGGIKRLKRSTFDVNDTALTSGKQSWSSTQKDDPEYLDRIIKSPVDRFDTFPEENEIELFGGDDGDEIVKLEVFADRLLVFKKNTLHILNISKDIEILESSHKGMGLNGGFPCQSCLTPNGVVWLNSNGVYLYNGKSIESLTDNKIESHWKGSAANYTTGNYTAIFSAADVPSIGYDYSSDKIIIHKTSTSSGSDVEDVWVYDTRFNSWIEINESLANNEVRTNMVNYDNMLIYTEDTGDSSTADEVKKYSDTPSSPGYQSTTSGAALAILTKPYDFGSPLTRKKIYKVYVTYRSDGATNVKCRYYVNGHVLTKTFTVDGSNPFGDSDNIDDAMELDDTSGEWRTAVFVPNTSSEANNVKSFGLYIYNLNNENPAATFEINDITIIYRNKRVK